MGTFIQRRLEDRVLTAVQRLAPIARDLELSLPQLALAWVLRRPEVAAAIVGASRPEQVTENAAASGVELDASAITRVEAAVSGVTAG